MHRKETTNTPKHRKKYKGLAAFPAIGLLLLGSCHTSPLYRGKLHVSPTGRGSPPLIRTGAKIALFSVTMRRVAVSNSQGHNWTGFHYPKDYFALYKGLSQAMQDKLHLEPLPPEKILNLSIYLDGYFPIREKFYLNPQKLPIIKSEKEEELMLRTARRLGVKYFATAVLDFHVSKFMTRPLDTTSQLSFQLYEKNAGLIYAVDLSDSRPALPYDRSLSLGELIKGYDPIVNRALNKSMAVLLKRLNARLSKDLRSIDMRVLEQQRAGM